MEHDAPQPDDGQPHGDPAVPPEPGMTPPPASMPGVPAAMPVMMYPEASQAVVALVLSIVGIVACGGVLCPVGWYLGSQEMKAIDAGRRDPSKRDLAQAAKIIGIIGTALVALAVIAVVGFAILAIIFSASAN